jgi:hypothetical protein
MSMLRWRLTKEPIRRRDAVVVLAQRAIGPRLQQTGAAPCAPPRRLHAAVVCRGLEQQQVDTLVLDGLPHALGGREVSMGARHVAVKVESRAAPQRAMVGSPALAGLQQRRQRAQAALHERFGWSWVTDDGRRVPVETYYSPESEASTLTGNRTDRCWTINSSAAANWQVRPRRMTRTIGTTQDTAEVRAKPSRIKAICDRRPRHWRLVALTPPGPARLARGRRVPVDPSAARQPRWPTQPDATPRPKPGLARHPHATDQHKALIAVGVDHSHAPWREQMPAGRTADDAQT